MLKVRKATCWQALCQRHGRRVAMLYTEVGRLTATDQGMKQLLEFDDTGTLVYLPVWRGMRGSKEYDMYVLDKMERESRGGF